MDSLQKLLDFLVELDQRHIAFALSRCRDEAIMVQAAVPGERWEIEFFADGHVEFETFKSDGSIQGEDGLKQLLSEFSD